MLRPELVSPPATWPVTLEEAKAHLRVDGGEDDTLIEGLIKAATGYFDGWTGVLGRCLVTQTWRQRFAGFDQCLRLPMPATEVSEVTNGIDVVDAGAYELLHDDRGSRVALRVGRTWPPAAGGHAPVAVTFRAGYGPADAVPPALKVAILIMVAHLYDNRGGSNQGGPPPAIDVLIAPYRVLRV